MPKSRSTQTRNNYFKIYYINNEGLEKCIRSVPARNLTEARAFVASIDGVKQVLRKRG